MKEVLVYQMVKQLPLAANRSQRRQIEKEYNMIVEKLNRIVLDYNHIITCLLYTSDAADEAYDV